MATKDNALCRLVDTFLLKKQFLHQFLHHLIAIDLKIYFKQCYLLLIFSYILKNITEQNSNYFVWLVAFSLKCLFHLQNGKKNLLRL